MFGYQDLGKIFQVLQELTRSCMTWQRVSSFVSLGIHKTSIFPKTKLDNAAKYQTHQPVNRVHSIYDKNSACSKQDEVVLQHYLSIITQNWLLSTAMYNFNWLN